MHKRKPGTQTSTGTKLYDLAFTLMDESQHGFIVLDCEQNILIWNKQIDRWSGISRGNSIGLPLLEIFPHLHQSALIETIAQSIQTGQTNNTHLHGLQAVLPLSVSLEKLQHEIHISTVPDLHGGNYCIIEITDTTGLHNIRQSFQTQTKEFDDLIRSSITNDAQLHALSDNPLFSILLVDQNGLVKKHNQRAEALFSRERTDWAHVTLSELILDAQHHAIGNDPLKLFTSTLPQYFAKGSADSSNDTQLTETTTETPIRLSSTRITLNKNFGFMIIIEDHHQQAFKTKLIEHAQQDIEVALNLVSDAIIKTDAQCIIRSFNNKAEQLTACSADIAIGTPLHEIISLVDVDSNSPFYISEHWISAHEQDACVRNLKVNLTRRDHLKVAIDLSVSTISYEHMAQASQKKRELILVLRDDTIKHECARKLAWHNTHDSLTGLVNRIEFEKRLDQLVRDVQSHQQHHAVLHLSLDQLEIINNSCGHDAGDALLREVTTLIKNKLGPQDTLARLSGDEFGVLLFDQNTAKAHKFAQTLNNHLYQHRFKWQNLTFPASTSIGLVSINIMSLDFRNVLSNAQSACLLAKESGRNRVQLYATGHNNLIKQQQRLHWHNRIHTALDNNDLALHAQLIVPADTLSGLSPRLELLVRIIDEGKLVLPDSFIPAAEHYQLMPKVDQWVVRNCLSYYAQLPEDSRIPININLSGQSIGDEFFLQFLIKQITQHNIDPSLLCFELTETAAIFDLDAAKTFINELAKMGCEFALDDFGSGLSSLSYLKSLPVNYLKIDGDFVKGIIGNHVDDEILQSINRIGHVMNIKTVAEYVETAEIRKRLQEIGIDYLQGFLIHKPVLLQDFFKFRPDKINEG